MTDQMWDYSGRQLTEDTFTMRLGFEEALTLKAVRAFVEATQDLAADAVVTVGEEFRQGHDQVVAIHASTRVDTYIDDATGPQPEPEIDESVGPIVEADVVGVTTAWRFVREIPEGVRFKSVSSRAEVTFENEGSETRMYWPDIRGVLHPQWAIERDFGARGFVAVESPQPSV